jgi:hypothetical protein
MSKYRIAKNTKGNDVWYSLQKYKWFFGFRWLADVDMVYYPNHYYSPEAVQEIIDAWTLPTHTEVYLREEKP